VEQRKNAIVRIIGKAVSTRRQKQSRVLFQNRVLHFLSICLIFPESMALGLTQPLIEMRTRSVSVGKARLERKTDNLTAICKPIS
jgi:hypothetical protein